MTGDSWGSPRSSNGPDVEVQMLAYEMQRAVDSVPFTAPEVFVDYVRQAAPILTRLAADAGEVLALREQNERLRAVGRVPALLAAETRAEAAEAERDRALADVASVKQLADDYAEEITAAHAERDRLQRAVAAVRAKIGEEVENDALGYFVSWLRDELDAALADVATPTPTTEDERLCRDCGYPETALRQTRFADSFRLLLRRRSNEPIRFRIQVRHLRRRSCVDDHARR